MCLKAFSGWASADVGYDKGSQTVYVDYPSHLPVKSEMNQKNSNEDFKLHIFFQKKPYMLKVSPSAFGHAYPMKMIIRLQSFIQVHLLVTTLRTRKVSNTIKFMLFMLCQLH